MSASNSFLHRLHRGLAQPALASIGPVKLKLRAYYFLPLVFLPLLFKGCNPGESGQPDVHTGSLSPEERAMREQYSLAPGQSPEGASWFFADPQRFRVMDLLVFNELSSTGSPRDGAIYKVHDRSTGFRFAASSSERKDQTGLLKFKNWLDADDMWGGPMKFEDPDQP